MQLLDKIKGLVLEQLDEDVEFDYNAPLFENGILTSLELVSLIDSLESNFNIEISPEEVNDEHFESVKSLTAFIESKT